jgi:Ni/Co efflux regulator RcnB
VTVVEERRSSPVSIEGRGERMGEEERGQRWRERRGERRRMGELPQSAPSPVMGEMLPSPRSVDTAPAVQSERRAGNLLRNRIATEGWRREWRDDRRFDWRRHRDRDRSRFRLGFYYDPFGWSYRRWNLGWNMPSRFYSSRYWINDPFHYRLPPTYGPYRWVRYWDDALLVDLRTGRVVDVLHNFFW